MSRCRSCKATIIALCVSGLFIVFFSGVAFSRQFQAPLISLASSPVAQNALLYVDPKTENQRIISQNDQRRLAKLALSNYVSPWYQKDITHITVNHDTIDIKHDLLALESFYLSHSRYGMNFHAYSRGWLEKLITNMDLKHFPNFNANAIIVHPTYLRSLPTDLPMYQSSTKAGQGYPFDELQISALWVGEPIKIIQISEDYAWALVLTHDYYGWVAIRDLAYVSHQFIHQYRQQHFVAAIKDNVTIRDGAHHFAFLTRIGMILPEKNHQMLIPVKGKQQQAILQAVPLNQKAFSAYPLAATAKNFAKLINEFIGEPYGWGGLNFYRDCSLTLQNLYLAFGIALPRNSIWQAHAGHYVDVSAMSLQQKRHFIAKNAKPFLTLLAMPGHITLYIGKQNKHLYIFQSKWGLHTKDLFGHEGRAVMGEAHIVPLDYGNHVRFSRSSLLRSTRSVTFVS